MKQIILKIDSGFGRRRLRRFSSQQLWWPSSKFQEQEVVFLLKVVKHAHVGIVCQFAVLGFTDMSHVILGLRYLRALEDVILSGGPGQAEQPKSNKKDSLQWLHSRNQQIL